MKTDCDGSGVYAIMHIPSGKSYIGSAKNLKMRCQDHVKLLRAGTHHNRHLQNSWNKHDEVEFRFDVLELVELTASSLVSAEQRYIDMLKPCFNIAPKAGTTLGIKRSEETRAKLRIYQRNRSPAHIENNKKHLAAVHASTEVRQKISETARNRTYSLETRAKLAHAGSRRNRDLLEKMWRAGKSPEAMEKKRVAMATPEVKEKMRQSQRNRGLETRANFLNAAKNKTAEHRDKIRQSILAVWSRAEFKEKMREAYALREERKRQKKLNAQSAC